MKITELLERLNMSDNYPQFNYHIVIFADGSGRITTEDTELLCFDNTEEMNKKLTKLWNELNNEPIEWEL